MHEHIKLTNVHITSTITIWVAMLYRIYKLEPKTRGCMSDTTNMSEYCKVLVIRIDVNVRIRQKSWRYEWF